MFNPCQLASGLSPVKITLVFDAASLLSDPYEEEGLVVLKEIFSVLPTSKSWLLGLIGFLNLFCQEISCCSVLMGRWQKAIIPIPKLHTLHHTFLLMLKKNSEVLHC